MISLLYHIFVMNLTATNIQFLDIWPMFVCFFEFGLRHWPTLHSKLANNFVTFMYMNLQWEFK